MSQAKRSLGMNEENHTEASTIIASTRPHLGGYDTEGIIEHLAADGTDGLALHAAWVAEHLHDVEDSIELRVGEGDVVFERIRRQGLTRTSQAVTWSESHVYKLSGGRVVEHWPHLGTEVLRASVSGHPVLFAPPPLSRKSRLIANAVGLIARVLPAASFPEASPAEQNRGLVSRYVNEFKNEQKFQVFPRLFSSRFTHHFDFAGQPGTAASFVNVGVNLLDGFPDVHVDLVHLVAQDDLVLEHNLVTASHKGAWAGFQQTDRHVTWREAHVYRIANGRIVENWPAVNFERLARQLSG
jgi:predicted ester cyclase